MERFVPIVLAVTALFTVIELGLTAYRKSFSLGRMNKLQNWY